ncbi:dihydrofolate reductase [Ferruginibacter yonginensis]|uniref:Dihydrofolate reductase n=1 Tax=Ferruginibacter yonginensis TaxID=1310416 RepID=A0ABV8QV96_9BACT
MKISIIVAASSNNAIGHQNKLLWHLPVDLKFFKNTTWGMPVIMGRKTFESVGKPLPGRLNIVVTSNAEWQSPNTLTATTLQSAIDKAATSNCNEIFITGGGEIYRQSMAIADIIYLTRVHTQIDGDTFFPEIDTNLWELTKSYTVTKDEKNAFDMTFETWQKITPTK